MLKIDFKNFKINAIKSDKSSHLQCLTLDNSCYFPDFCSSFGDDLGASLTFLLISNTFLGF